MGNQLALTVLLCDELAKRVKAKGYKWADFSSTDVENQNSEFMVDDLGAAIYKRWQVYRKFILRISIHLCLVDIRS